MTTSATDEPIESWDEDIITADEAGTLDGLLRERVRRSPEVRAYRDFDKQRGDWLDTSWGEFAREVARWQAGLKHESLAPGDRVALLMRNRREWVVFDQAALGLGLVTVPLYVDDRPDNIAYILKESGTRLLLVGEASVLKRVAPTLRPLEELRRILVYNGESDATDERVRSVGDWLPAIGRAAAPAARKGDPNALASIVYTSGTTGRPKGVMLSHRNILSVAHAALTMIDVYRQDVFLSFLPLSHTLERTGGYVLPMMSGATVAYARSVAQLGEDLTTIRPTALISVPRIYERVYARIQQQLEKRSPAARLLFRLAVHSGWNYFEYRQGRARWSPLHIIAPALQRKVGARVQEKLGGRLRAAVSGGAAMPTAVARLFIGLGVPILQGYGMTETSPVVSVNTLERNDPRSVGIALRGIDLKIGADDELLVKSPGNMLGYWNNHAATADVIDPDGWLHTGDQARIENDFVYITGRLKDILVLSNGEKLPPVDMEDAIMLDDWIDQCVVIGEGKAFLAALLVLNKDHWFGLAKSLGLDPYSRESLGDERLRKKILLRVRNQLRGFPGYAKIRRAALLLEPWTLEDGLVTPTLKIKRAKVIARHADLIEDLYAE